MARLRKTLPKDFDVIVRAGDQAAFEQVFEACDVNARDRSLKTPALSFFGMSEAFVRWLVDRGADLHVTDDRGRTPLHDHAASWCGVPAVLLELGAEVDRRDADQQTPLFGARLHLPNVQVLLEAGADPVAVDEDGLSVLEYWLWGADNRDIEGLAQTVPVLVAAGAQVTEPVRTRVQELGQFFEETRELLDEEALAELEPALNRIYELVGVDPVASVVRHDGVSPIELPSGNWAQQYNALWDYLVPAAGHAATVQGEVIRVTGRVAAEIGATGSINWDADFAAMLNALPGYVSQGEPLADLEELRGLVKGMRRGRATEDELVRLRELALHWVAANLAPLPLPTPPYRR